MSKKEPDQSTPKPSINNQSNEPPHEPKSISSTSPSVDNDSGLSDLERLLAEEGIELSAVSEARPAGAENMSAKDWMISTSKEELVRKKLDTEAIDAESWPASAPESTSASVAEPAPVGALASEPELETDHELGAKSKSKDPFSIVEFLRTFRKKSSSKNNPYR